MRKRALLLIALLAFYPNVKGDDYDFKTFKLGLSSHGGGSFNVSIDGRKLASGLLFFNHKTAEGATQRYFQNSNFVKGKITPTLSRDGNNIVLTFSGVMKRKGDETSIPFSETITAQPDGTLKFEYELETPADWEYKETPRVLVSLPISEVSGKKIVQKSEKKEKSKIISEVYSKKTRAFGSNVKELSVGTDFGFMTFTNQDLGIAFHDTRSYKENGPIRIDLNGKKSGKKWQVSFSLKMPVDSIELLPKK